MSRTACGYEEETADVQAGSCQCSELQYVGFSCSVPVKVYCRKSQAAIRREQQQAEIREQGRRNNAAAQQLNGQINQTFSSKPRTGGGACAEGDEQCGASGYLLTCKLQRDGSTTWDRTAQRCRN